MSSAGAAARTPSRRGLAFLAGGHASVDMVLGAVPAMLPFLVTRRGYSYAAASALVLAMMGTSSLIQPLFGHLADRRSLPWLLPGGTLVAGTGVALAGVMPNYALTLAVVALAGLGAGAFHPEAARYATYVSGARKTSGMSIFAVGGNAGFALGPILLTPLLLASGLSGTIWLAVPMALVSLALARALPHLLSFRPVVAAGGDAEADANRGVDRWGTFSLVAGIAALRSGVYVGLQSFVPLYFVAAFGASAGVGNAALAVLLVSGAIGTLAGGAAAEHVGRRPVLVVSLAVLTPLILLLLAAGPIAGFAIVALVGFFTVGTFSLTVVLGQELLPNRIGTASGVTLGAAIGIGGVVAALLGVLADHAGLTAVMLVIAACPLPALGLSLLLPREVT